MNDAKVVVADRLSVQTLVEVCASISKHQHVEAAEWVDECIANGILTFTVLGDKPIGTT